MFIPAAFFLTALATVNVPPPCPSFADLLAKAKSNPATVNDIIIFEKPIPNYITTCHNTPGTGLYICTCEPRKGAECIGGGAIDFDAD